MITIHIELLLSGEKAVKELSLPEDSIVSDLIKELGIGEEDDFLVLVNGVNRLYDYNLQNDDRVQVFHRLSGG